MMPLIRFFCFLTIAATAFPAGTFAANHALPMTIDYSLLTALAQKQYYTGSGQQAVVLDEEDGCQQIILTDPRFYSQGGRLILETRVKARLGKRLMGACMAPVSWEGFLKVTQEPWIHDASWRLSFHILDSTLLGNDGKPAAIAGWIWGFVKDNVHAWLESMKFDLSPPIKQVQDFLVPLFAEMEHQEALNMVSSLKPGNILIQPDQLRLMNVIDIPEKAFEEPEEEKLVLSETEIEAFTEYWETWDTYLITLLLSLVEEPLLEQERQVLLDVILETRYTFIQELDDPGSPNDFIREQFMEAWDRIRPIFKRHLSNQAKKSLLSYLAFFSASDALVYLDTIGPSLGIEITQDGFTRLIKLLAAGELTPLPMTQNNRLRELLGLNKWSEDPAPSDQGSSKGFPVQQINALFTVLFQPESAYAASVPSKDNPGKDDLKAWIVDRNNFNQYLSSVRKMVDETARELLKQSKLPKAHHQLFLNMIPATAWQESCFRQYKKESSGSIVYLRSYNSSSVGMMQINERVWKGMYDVNRLRWDIRYNTKAGADILDIYFNRYALRYMGKIKSATHWSPSTLAVSIYAMYNGGPKQFRQYAERLKNNSFYKIDVLFKEKFDWVTKKDYQKLTICLF